MNDSPLQVITEILAVGAGIQPIFMAMVFLFMFKYFPTRKEVELQETNQLSRHEENKLRFGIIERDVKELLKRKI